MLDFPAPLDHRPLSLWHGLWYDIIMCSCLVVACSPSPQRQYHQGLSHVTSEPLLSVWYGVRIWNVKIPSCIQTPSFYQSRQHDPSSGLTQHTVKKPCVVMWHLQLGHQGRRRLMWTCRNALHIFKLVQHVIRKITDHVRFVS